MRPNVLIALSVGSTLALAGLALALQPPPSPAATGPLADYGPPITNEQAKTVAAAALAEAKKNNWRMALAIVGPAGGPALFLKGGGAHAGGGGNFPRKRGPPPPVLPALQRAAGPVARGRYPCPT